MTKVHVVTISFGRFGCVRGKREECMIKNYDRYTNVDIAKVLIEKYKINTAYYKDDMRIASEAIDILPDKAWQDLSTYSSM